MLQAAGNPIGDVARCKHCSLPQPVEFAIGRNLDRQPRLAVTGPRMLGLALLRRRKGVRTRALSAGRRRRLGRRKDRGMSGTGEGRKVHLVGSAPFATAEEMFRAAAARLGRRRAGHAASRPPTFLCFKGVRARRKSSDARMSARSRAGGDDRSKALKEIFERLC